MHSKYKEVLLIGYYGRNNTGDDAMLFSLLSLLKDNSTIKKYTVPTNIQISVPEELLNQVKVIPRRPLSILAEIIQTDAILIGGGTIFHDYSKKIRYIWASFRYLILITWARFLKKPVYLVGIGFGPFTTTSGRLIALLISRLVNYITVRDVESYKYLQTLHVPTSKYNLTFDLSGNMAEINLQEKVQSNILGVSIIPFFYGYSNNPRKDIDLAYAIAKSLNKWLVKDPLCEIHFLTFLGIAEGDGDIKIIQRVYQLIEEKNRVKIIDYSSDPRILLSHFNKCRAIVTMRYHAAVFAYLTKRPMIVLNYHPKCQSFVNDIGLTNHAVLSIQDILEGKLIDSLNSLFSSPDLHLAKLPLSEARRLVNFALPPLLRG